MRREASGQLPDSLDRGELWTVGRQEQQSQASGMATQERGEEFCVMVAGIVEHEEHSPPRDLLSQQSLEETLEADDEAPRKEFGTRDVKLTGSIDRLQLQRAIDRLPPGYRTVFVLHDVEGFEHNEIAQIVGCSIGNSKSQLHKARLKLRDYLKFMRAEKAKTG